MKRIATRGFQAFFRKLINIGSKKTIVSIAVQIAVAQVITEDEDEIGGRNKTEAVWSM